MDMLWIYRHGLTTRRCQQTLNMDTDYSDDLLVMLTKYYPVSWTVRPAKRT